MTLDEFLALWLVLTIVVAYLGTVTLFCLVVPRLVDWAIKSNGGA
jgi:hypothetical protein